MMTDGVDRVNRSWTPRGAPEGVAWHLATSVIQHRSVVSASRCGGCLKVRLEPTFRVVCGPLSTIFRAYFTNQGSRTNLAAHPLLLLSGSHLFQRRSIVGRAVGLIFGMVALVLLNVSPAYAVATVPEPATTVLLGTAVAGLAIRAYRRRRRQ